MHIRVIAARPMALVALLLSGCSGALNTSDDVQGEALPDLRGAMPTALPAPETASLTNGHDRSHWAQPHGNIAEPTTIVVEERQVEAFPTYVSTPLYEHTTARARGEWPTTLSALELGGDEGMMAVEGLAAPLWAAFDLVVAPVRMCQRPPWATVRYPEEPPLVPTAVPTANAPAVPGQ